GMGIELIRFGRGVNGHSGYGLGMGGYRFPYAIAVKIPAHPWPIPGPAHGLEMYYAAIGIRILKMKEPVPPTGGVHPGPLMGPIGLCGTLFQNHFFFIGAVYVLGPQYQLPSSGHPSGWGKNIVVPI